LIPPYIKKTKKNKTKQNKKNTSLVVKQKMNRVIGACDSKRKGD
jgi:hypothetical protein